jgi:ribosomal protein L37AE/L43A
VAETSHATRQAVLYCPYCAEETLFPLEEGGWECRSCMRAFSVTFLGLSSRGHSERAPETSQQESA